MGKSRAHITSYKNSTIHSLHNGAVISPVHAHCARVVYDVQGVTRRRPLAPSQAHFELVIFWKTRNKYITPSKISENINCFLYDIK